MVDKKFLPSVKASGSCLRGRRSFLNFLEMLSKIFKVDHFMDVLLEHAGEAVGLQFSTILHSFFTIHKTDWVDFFLVATRPNVLDFPLFDHVIDDPVVQLVEVVLVRLVLTKFSTNSNVEISTEEITRVKL